MRAKPVMTLCFSKAVRLLVQEGEVILPVGWTLLPHHP